MLLKQRREIKDQIKGEVFSSGTNGKEGLWKKKDDTRLVGVAGSVGSISPEELRYFCPPDLPGI